MRLQDVFTKENIIFELTATQKGETIRELIGRLCETGSLAQDNAADAERAIVRREELGSTGIGKVVAVPHAKHPGVKGVTGVLGRSTEGIAFESLDGQPVHLVFLLISSPDAVEPHLAALRKVTALLKDNDLCAFLQRAKNGAELMDLLQEADERVSA